MNHFLEGEAMLIKSHRSNEFNLVGTLVFANHIQATGFKAVVYVLIRDGDE